MLNSTLQRPQLSAPSSDRDLRSTECQQLWRWRAQDAQLAMVRSLHGSGVSIRQAVAGAYRMPGSFGTNNPTQGVRIAMTGVAHVTNTKFSTRLGPPPDRPV